MHTIYETDLRYVINIVQRIPGILQGKIIFGLKAISHTVRYFCFYQYMRTERNFCVLIYIALEFVSSLARCFEAVASIWLSLPRQPAVHSSITTASCRVKQPSSFAVYYQIVLTLTLTLRLRNRCRNDVTVYHIPEMGPCFRCLQLVPCSECMRWRFSFS